MCIEGFLGDIHPAVCVDFVGVIVAFLFHYAFI